MKFTFICENCRREARHVATVAQEKQLIKTLSMSFPCPVCDKTLQVQMCEDGSTVVSISGMDSPVNPFSASAVDSAVGSRDHGTGKIPVADAPSVSPAPRAAPPPPLPESRNAGTMGQARDEVPAVTGHVPFESLDDLPQKRMANTGVAFLDSLINDPPTTTQIILGISLIVAAVLVYKYEPGGDSSSPSEAGSTDTTATPARDAQRSDVPMGAAANTPSKAEPVAIDESEKAKTGDKRPNIPPTDAQSEFETDTSSVEPADQPNSAAN